MEMEHINENTIRVIIDDADLKERGFNMLDLLGNQGQIESFFYSILEEVDIDDTFRENDMITFQVVPIKKGLELYISKDISDLENPMERFQNYYQQLGIESDIQSDDEFHWIGARPVSDENKDGTESNYDETNVQAETVIKFSDIEEAIAFAQQLKLERGLSFLHYYQDSFYMTLVQFLEGMPEDLLKHEISIALEYGEKSKLSLSALNEHGQEIIEGNALEVLRKYFS